jgi:hypothetical protein
LYNILRVWCPRLLVNFRKNFIFLRWVVRATPNPQTGGPPLVGCPRLLIQYIRSYHPYLEAVPSIRTLRTRHAVVTRNPPNMVEVPMYQSRMRDEGDCGEIGGMKIGKGNRSTRGKTCPSATLSTTNPTWLDPDLNPDRRGGKPATNRLSLGSHETSYANQIVFKRNV